MKYTVPNMISFLRVIIAPAFYFSVLSENASWIRIGVVLFIFGAITDYFDGWVARKYKVVSSFGKFFDPLADKILVTSALLAFISLELVPLWMVVIIVLRDITTTLIRVYADSKKFVIETSYSAKLKTFLQMTLIIVILLFIYLKSDSGIISDAAMIDSILYSQYIYFSFMFITILTLWTSIEYFKKNKFLLNLLKLDRQ